MTADEPQPPTTAAGTPPQTPSEHLVRQLYSLSAVRRELVRAANREMASHGFAALVTLHRGQAARVSEIATALQIDLSVASRQIAALVSAGYVERKADPDDGRAQLLHLTDAGRAVIVQAHRHMVDLLDETLVDWDADKISALANGLEELITSFLEAPACTTPSTTAEPEVRS